MNFASKTLQSSGSQFTNRQERPYNMCESTMINRNSYLYANEEEPKTLKRNMSVQTMKNSRSKKKQYLNIVSNTQMDDRQNTERVRKS